MRAIEIETNASALALVFGNMSADQVPYASANALTTLAFNAQRVEKSEIARHLHLRNKFSQSGLQVNKANKADWPHQQSEVGIEQKRSYLIDQVLSGQRQGGSHGRAIIADLKLRNANGRVTGPNKPRALIKLALQRTNMGRKKGSKNGQRSTPLPFIIKSSSKWSNEVLVRRTSADRYPLQILYAFKRNVRIKRAFEMDTIAERVIAGQYYQVYAKALARALATAKPKAERSASSSAGQIIDSGR